MPAPTLVRPSLSLGPGYLFAADIGSTEPAYTVAGSVFTDAWPGAWSVLGATSEGHVFNFQISTEPVDAAEYFYPLQHETSGHDASIEFALLDIRGVNMKLASNGGTITSSGTGATLLTRVKPPVPGSETNKMIGWESRDSTERLIIRSAFQTGQVGINRRKGGANKGMIPVVFTAQEPSTGLVAWEWFGAGTARA